ncbi:unnamed protein product [Enterobius vermicularis]|uniref:Uncharacterized protein n=1 Tax=Enterobius vermicularis TaxID=51028 RepID=A0A0N4VRI9_ENTVE|nr:unnamed protein product [Enterobius vermicularis]
MSEPPPPEPPATPGTEDLGENKIRIKSTETESTNGMVSAAEDIAVSSATGARGAGSEENDVETTAKSSPV